MREYDLQETIDLAAVLDGEGDDCGLYCDQAEAIRDSGRIEGWEAWRVRAYEDGAQVSGNAIKLVYDATDGIAGVCEGGETEWGAATSAEDALERYARGTLQD